LLRRVAHILRARPFPLTAKSLLAHSSCALSHFVAFVAALLIAGGIADAMSNVQAANKKVEAKHRAEQFPIRRSSWPYWSM
jgi:hypothetical protein